MVNGFFLYNLPAGMFRRASPRESPLAAAAFSAMMAASSRARPLLSPLQSLDKKSFHFHFYNLKNQGQRTSNKLCKNTKNADLKLPRSHWVLGWQYPNSEQHDACWGQTVYFKAEGSARNGAAGQDPSPVPAPKRPAWQLASKVAKHACTNSNNKKCDI